jgi:hypothetical protein
LQKSISKGLKEKSSFKSVELCQFRGQPTIEYESIKYKDEIIKTLKPLPDSSFIACNNDVAFLEKHIDNSIRIYYSITIVIPGGAYVSGETCYLIGFKDVKAT